MTKPRSKQISLSATSNYHCVSRCVRKAFLCGKNYDESKDYEHRRGWIEERLLELSGIFTIDIISYAIMSNHYHVILSVNQDRCEDLSDKEVVERWHKLFNGNSMTHDFAKGLSVSPSLLADLDETITTWRERLTSISWFMRCINEYIAKEANKEDECTGRFWEGRFKSQALLDDKALLACMAYVDLNPVRANIAENLEDSAHTSIKRRLDIKANNEVIVPHRVIMPFKDEKTDDNQNVIPATFIEYAELVEWTGMQIRAGGKGVITAENVKFLNKLGIEDQHWLFLTRNFESKLKTLVGGLAKLKNAYRQFSIKRIAGKNACNKHFGT